MTAIYRNHGHGVQFTNDDLRPYEVIHPGCAECLAIQKRANEVFDVTAYRVSVGYENE